MHTSKIIKQVIGLHWRRGGEEHSGWLPPGAAIPLPTPVRHAIVDVTIEDYGDGYLLICESRNTADSWDTWHPTLEEAEEQAESWLGIRPSDWEPVS
jgi:hypothetical protein